MSGFYVGVDGKARKIKGGYVGIDGVARKVKKGYIGDENGIARLCYTELSFDPVFANNTWEDVIAACQNNAVPDTWSVGDQMTMTIDGTEYAVDIIGKNHDDYSDGSGKAPLTFQLHDCYKVAYNMNNTSENVGGWSTCKMKHTYLNDIFALLQPSIMANIKEVTKTTNGFKSSDKLFLLSETEVFGTSNYAAESVQYDFYKSNSAIKNASSWLATWWLRTLDVSTLAQFCCVGKNGALSSDYSTANNYVSFAFCF